MSYNQAIEAALQKEKVRSFTGKNRVAIFEIEAPKRNKYGVAAREDRTYEGIEFDSKREMLRFKDLILLERAGEIIALQRQVPFVLLDDFEYKGKKERGIRYIADFCYRERATQRVVVEDSKGKRTAEYIIKRKLFLKRYPYIDFREV